MQMVVVAIAGEAECSQPKLFAGHQLDRCQEECFLKTKKKKNNNNRRKEEPFDAPAQPPWKEERDASGTRDDISEKKGGGWRVEEGCTGPSPSHCTDLLNLCSFSIPSQAAAVKNW
jgi:hypothetical protein